MNRSKRWLGLLIGVFSLIAAATVPAHAFCYDDPHSSYTFVDGSAVCAYSGGGCSYCFVSGGRGSGSWDLCYYDWVTSDLTCTYWM